MAGPGRAHHGLRGARGRRGARARPGARRPQSGAAQPPRPLPPRPARGPAGHVSAAAGGLQGRVSRVCRGQHQHRAVAARCPHAPPRPRSRSRSVMHQSRDFIACHPPSPQRSKSKSRSRSSKSVMHQSRDFIACHPPSPQRSKSRSRSSRSVMHQSRDFIACHPPSPQRSKSRSRSSRSVMHQSRNFIACHPSAPQRSKSRSRSRSSGSVMHQPGVLLGRHTCSAKVKVSDRRNLVTLFQFADFARSLFIVCRSCFSSSERRTPLGFSATDNKPTIHCAELQINHWST